MAVPQNRQELLDPLRGKPCPSGRGRIALTAKPSLPLPFSEAADDVDGRTAETVGNVNGWQ